MKKILAAVASLTTAIILLTGCSLDGNGTTDVFYQKSYQSPQSQTDFKTKTKNKNSTEVKISSAVRYFCGFYPKEEQEAVNAICDGINHFDDHIKIKYGTIKKEDIGLLVSMITSSSPEMDYIDSGYSIDYTMEYVTGIRFLYTRNRKQHEAEMNRLNKCVDEIMAGVQDNWNDYDKVLYFHDAIISRCTYDESSASVYTAYGCLVNGKAVCEGYSKAIQLLCEKAGIQCIPVNGNSYSDGKPQAHAWNKIQIGGIWSAFDLTWDDPMTSMGTDYCRYDYFGLTDAEMSADHFVGKNRCMKYPEAFSKQNNYFVRSKLLVTNKQQINTAMKKAIAEAAMNKSMYARVKFDSDKLFNAAVQKLFNAEKGKSSAVFDILSDVAAQTGARISTSNYSVIQNSTSRVVTIKLEKS